MCAQSADDFHNKYDEFIKNDNQTGAADDHDRELILRSFTDSPDIPLQQIKVGWPPWPGDASDCVCMCVCVYSKRIFGSSLVTTMRTKLWRPSAR